MPNDRFAAGGSNFFNRDFGDFLSDPAIIELSDAGGVQFTEDEWWPMWVHCSAVSNEEFGSFSISGDPLTAHERDRLLAVKSDLEGLLHRLDGLDIGLVQRLNSFVNPKYVNALSPDYKGVPQRPLFDRIAIGQQIAALSNFLKVTRIRRRAERFGPRIVTLIATLRQMHWRAKARLPKSKRKQASFDSFLSAVIARMPVQARRRMPSPMAARKLLLRRLKRQENSGDK